jgi:hypothetical protein
VVRSTSITNSSAVVHLRSRVLVVAYEKGA